MKAAFELQSSLVFEKHSKWFVQCSLYHIYNNDNDEDIIAMVIIIIIIVVIVIIIAAAAAVVVVVSYLILFSYNITCLS